jgi:hypothetical protein
LEMGVSRTVCPGWPWTMILQISVSQVARCQPAVPSLFLLLTSQVGCRYNRQWNLQVQDLLDGLCAPTPKPQHSKSLAEISWHHTFAHMQIAFVKRYNYWLSQSSSF